MPRDRNSKYYKDNPYGARSLMVYNLKDAIKQGDIKTEEELHVAIEDIVNKINECVPELCKMIETRKGCTHEFGKAQYTFRETFSSYLYVYERTCKTCGFTDTHTQSAEERDKTLPDWTEGATQRPYNNFI